MLLLALRRLPGPLVPKAQRALTPHPFRNRRRYGRLAVTGSPSRPRRYRQRTARPRASGVAVPPAGYPFEPTLP